MYCTITSIGHITHYDIHSTSKIVRHKMYAIACTSYNIHVQYTVYVYDVHVHCTSYSVRHTVCRVHYLCRQAEQSKYIHCTLYTVR